MTATPVLPQTIRQIAVTIVPADTTALKTLIVAGSNGTRVTSLACMTDETANKDITLYYTISATDYKLTVMQIPLGAGNTNSVPSIDVLRNQQLVGVPYDFAGAKFIDLASGTTLKVAANATLTAAKTHFYTGTAYDF